MPSTTRSTPTVYKAQRDIPPQDRDQWAVAKKLVVYQWELQGKGGLKTTKKERTAFLWMLDAPLKELLQGWAPYAQVLDHVLDNQRNKKKSEDEPKVGNTGVDNS